MNFFLTSTVRGTFHRKDFKWRKYGGITLLSEKTEVLYAELKERAEAATGSYSVTGDSLQYIYSVPVTKNHRNIRWRCLVHEFSFADIFNDINHGYQAALLKKKSLWLLPLYMAVATYFYYEKVCRTMRTAIVSNLLNDQITQKYFMNFKCKTFRNLAGFFFFTSKEAVLFLPEHLERCTSFCWYI